jgi:putative endonuclease
MATQLEMTGGTLQTCPSFFRDQQNQRNPQVWHWFAGLWRPQLAQEVSLGDRGEAAAGQYLQGLGYRILERQFRNRFGELDLVAIDGSVVVFVEVKTRTTLAAGHPTEAITAAKQRKMTRAALAYLKRRGWLNRRTRFDVVAVLWSETQPAPEIQHYIHAFESGDFGQMYS